MKKVMVLMGGFSAEREVSLVSGKGVLEALIRAGYAAYAYDLKNIDDFLAEIKGNRPDVVFNALHGNWGEDGEIQALLDLMQIPYTHSGMKASLLGMDKELTKMVAAGVGIKIAMKLKGINQERIGGVDFSRSLIELCVRNNYRLALLGAKDEVMSALVSKLKSEYNDINIVFAHNGYFNNE